MGKHSQEAKENRRRLRTERKALWGGLVKKRKEEPDTEGYDYQDYSLKYSQMKPKPRYEGSWDE